MYLIKAMRGALVLLLVAVGVQSEARNVKIDAAYRFSPYRLLMFAGDEVAWIDAGNVAQRYSSKSDYSGTDRQNLEIKAVFESPKLDYYNYYSSKSGFTFNARDDDYTFKNFRYGPRRKFVRGGPDAVARKGTDVYVFKGCKMALRKAWNDWRQATDVRDAGLPCHIDAAWNEKEDMGLVRGDQVWYWKANDTVDGPYDFNTRFTIDRWHVVPYDGPED